MTINALAPSRPATTAGALRLLMFGRLLPATFFAMLGFIQWQRLLTSVHGLPRPTGVLDVLAGPLPSALYLLFCTIPVFIYVGRPAPRARDGRWLPRIAALTGTVMLLVVGALPQGARLYTAPSWLAAVSTTLSVFAFGLAVYGLLYLRRSLSIIPEARRLVNGGPYRIVRHPLYAAEIIAAFAFVLVSPGVLPTLVLVPFVVVQLVRARFEEHLLTQTYPQYRVYAARTRRLIPFVW